jgi:hypothetical protein
VITAAALCPHPPLLFRELTGSEDVAAPLRAACRAAVQAATAGRPDTAVVAGAADVARAWDPGLTPEVRRFGTTGPREPAGLPLSLGVGVRLLAEAGWDGPVERVSLTWDADKDEVERLARTLADRPDEAVLVVLGDGSARRGEKAPGYLDDRSFGYDERTGRALADGDAQALLDLDPVLADELMVLGRPAFQLLGAVALAQGSVPRPTMHYQDDPFGVMYFVADWQLA